MIIQNIALAALVLANVAGPELPSHSGRPRIEVLAQTTTGDALAGVTVWLCRMDGSQRQPPVPQASPPANCSHVFTNQDGRGVFDALKPGFYAITAELSGFASTSVFPLSIAGPDPIAPDKLVVVLNGVCHDCVHREKQ
jgi:hypothetical protein